MSTSAVPGEIRIETVSRRAWLGFAAVLPWQFLAVLDFFVVNIAIPSIKGGLSAQHSDSHLYRTQELQTEPLAVGIPL
jgi:hypothetical protein